MESIENGIEFTGDITNYTNLGLPPIIIPDSVEESIIADRMESGLG